MPTPTLPTPETRWRCARCGNLTRFDVTRSTRSVEFWHFDLAGDSKVEATDVLEEELVRVRCRWCESVDDVQVVARNDVDPGTAPGGRAEG